MGREAGLNEALGKVQQAGVHDEAAGYFMNGAKKARAEARMMYDEYEPKISDLFFANKPSVRKLRRPGSVPVTGSFKAFQ
jgi:hypothetical protein